MTEKKPIIVRANIQVPVSRAWQYWTGPEHITKWNHASDDWHCPRATNDVREGSTFVIRMEAKDGSAGFDFGGTYTEVVPEKRLAYTMGDGRKVLVLFEGKGNETQVTEEFEPEQENPVEMQRKGWQAILDTFKEYTESQ